MKFNNIYSNKHVLFLNKESNIFEIKSRMFWVKQKYVFFLIDDKF